MDYLRRFEKIVENIVEGKFFQKENDLHPIEMARAVVKAARDRRRTLCCFTFAPDSYQLCISVDIFKQYETCSHVLEKELSAYLKFEADALDIRFLAPPTIRILCDSALQNGGFSIKSYYFDRKNKVLQTYMNLLAIKEGFGQGELFYWAVGERILGRKSPSDFLICDPMLSSVHCRFVSDVNSCFIEDLDSKSGVFINGKSVKKQILAGGDEIKVANNLLVYCRI